MCRSEQAGRADSDGAPADSPAPSAAPSAGGGGLADLFKAPDNVFKGTFEAAKMTATKQNRWLVGLLSLSCCLMRKVRALQIKLGQGDFEHGHDSQAVQ